MIVVDDNIHSDLWFRFTTFEGAVTWLKHLSEIAWDERFRIEPRATSGERADGNTSSWSSIAPGSRRRYLRCITVLSISAEGVNWTAGFEQAWAAAAR